MTEIEQMAKEAASKMFDPLYKRIFQELANAIAENCARECDLLAEDATPSQQLALDVAADRIRAKYPMPSNEEDAAK